jgi:hypothetical protein
MFPTEVNAEFCILISELIIGVEEGNLPSL